MAVELGRKTIIFPPGVGIQNLNDTVTFTTAVLDAGVAMEGFKLEFDTAAPVAHRVDVMQADVQFVQIVGNDVQFQVTVNLADGSGNDSYKASVDVFVIALT